MKHLLFGAQGTSGFATPAVNWHIMFLFDAAAEQSWMAKSSFDPFPYVCLQGATFMQKLLGSSAIVSACAVCITAWNEERSVHTTKATPQAAAGTNPCHVP